MPSPLVANKSGGETNSRAHGSVAQSYNKSALVHQCRVEISYVNTTAADVAHCTACAAHVPTYALIMQCIQLCGLHTVITDIDVV